MRSRWSPKCGSGLRRSQHSTTAKPRRRLNFSRRIRTTLGEPHSRSLGDGIRELRFSLSGNAIRVTYWLLPGKRIVLLTVFRKSKMREDAEVKRAKQARMLCEAEHGPAHRVFSRDVQEEL